MLICIVYACALNAQTNEVATPLFSLNVKNVVSMYCDEHAETFYLHTKTSKFDGMKYTVSREGEILAEEPSKMMWACWEDGVMYTHAWCDEFFLNEKGDTVVKGTRFNMRLAQPMCRKNGVFYWWYGPIEGVMDNNTIFSYKDGDEEPIHLRRYSLHCTGIVVLDNKVLCTGYNSERTGYYSIYFIDGTTDWTYQTQLPKELPGLKYPVGLSLAGDKLYVWSNDTQTLYSIPKSFFGGVTSVQAPVVDTDNESIYSIDGRPADGTRKGIYIRNGKKVLVR